ncbi:L,D-transpeptidase [Roseovarius faecimaris]|uniref:L,D-transpeptidase n=1 Tax=Roseovarius faecimaris TaxID=2494550 RepID=A0A6I6IP48_9RHOB|nr:L,D-transpeptidase [Roseovarius faecimaris]QGX96976.1 L,D-transpeptidase [Roseovarius faecimaris]
MTRRLLAVLTLLASAGHGQAGEVNVQIDLSDQQMVVQVDSVKSYVWPVSTARPGKCTPVGTYKVQSMKRMHYSTLYNNAPMPWSIFFHGNYAIHGTTQTDQLGSPASAGCVRLHPENAETLFNLVLENGRDLTVIEIAE